MHVAVRTQIKLGVGPNQLGDAHPEDLLDQAYRVSQRGSRFMAAFVWFTSAEPPFLARIEEMVSWAGLPRQYPSPVIEPALPREVDRGAARE
jgi:hypothetical protein